jgi:hypothetical protein
MTLTTNHRPTGGRAVLALLAMTLAAVALSVGANVAGAHDPDDDARAQHRSQRLVIRGEATVTEGGCSAGICHLFTNGSFRATPIGIGAYSGAIDLVVGETFDNGEGGVCAPIDGQMVLGAGSPDRLVLALSGDSCQDGAGDPTKASFTTVTRFKVKHATGAYAGTRGGGVASFSEDAADHEHVTLIGRIRR